MQMARLSTIKKGRTMTKKEIIERLCAIAHTEQEAIPSTAEEREAEYRALVIEILKRERKH